MNSNPKVGDKLTTYIGHGGNGKMGRGGSELFSGKIVKKEKRGGDIFVLVESSEGERMWFEIDSHGRAYR